MKNIFKVFVVIFLFGSFPATAQKVKYSKEELSHLKSYYFNEGFSLPSRKKISTLILKDGSEEKGYCQNVKTKKGQIHTFILNDSITGETKEFSADNIAEAYVFARGIEKFGKLSDQIGRAGTSKRNDTKKATTDDEIYFVSLPVSLNNKRKEQYFLMQLLNPDFDDVISVYYDPAASESKGTSVGGLTLGGGVLKAYYFKKGDRIFRLGKSDFKKEYDNLFGDNKEFMEKYPLNSVNWDWLSALVVEYTKMSL